MDFCENKSKRKKESTENLIISLVTPFFPKHRGGVEIVAGKLAIEISKDKDCSVRWISSDCDSPPKEKLRLHAFPVRSSNFIEAKLNLPYPLWTASALKVLQEKICSSDVLHIHDFIYFGNLFAFIIAKLKNKPILVTQHIGFVPYKSKLLCLILSIINKTIGYVVLRNADQVVFISEAVEKYFSGFINFPRSPVYIPNGVDTKVFKVVGNDERMKNRESLGLPPDRLIFIFVGRFVEKKGLNFLEKLAPIFKEVYWVFAGKGAIHPNHWKMSNAKVFENLHGASLATLYQAADLLVLPSKGEGFPLVVQESMTCGTPVFIGTETAQGCSGAMHLFWHERVETDNALILWEKRLRELIASPNKLHERRSEVAEYSKNNWSWKKCAADYESIIKRLCAVTAEE